MYTQPTTTHETPAVTAEVTTTGEVDHSLEINRYDHIYTVHDPNLRTTCYSSVGSDSDSEKPETRRVRISMELSLATNLIQKKLAQRLDEFHASSSGSSTHTVLPEDHTESEVDRMLASSDEDTPQAPQALQSIDISNIPPDFNFPPTENFQPIVESLIKENTKIYSTMKKTHQQIHYCPYLRQVQEQSGKAALPLVVEFAPTEDVNNVNKSAMQMAKDFISTLAIFQKNYPGLVLALACPPFHDRSHSLPAYQRLKGTNSRISES